MPRLTFQPAVYIVTNRKLGKLYVGVTSNLIERVWQHQSELVDGFSRRFQLHRLVYYELHATMLNAIAREKQLKRWRRAWKLQLIDLLNPEWADLYPSLLIGRLRD